MTRGGEGGKKCPNLDDVICERPLRFSWQGSYLRSEKFRREKTSTERKLLALMPVFASTLAEFAKISHM